MVDGERRSGLGTRGRRGFGLLGPLCQLYLARFVRRLYALRQHDDHGPAFNARRTVLLRSYYDPVYVFGFVAYYHTRVVEGSTNPSLNKPFEQCKVVESVDFVSKDAPYYGEGGAAPFSTFYVLMATLPFWAPIILMAVVYWNRNKKKERGDDGEDEVPRMETEVKGEWNDGFDREPQQSDDLELLKYIQRDVEQPSSAAQPSRQETELEEERELERAMERAMERSMDMVEKMAARMAQMQFAGASSQSTPAGAGADNNATDGSTAAPPPVTMMAQMQAAGASNQYTPAGGAGNNATDGSTTTAPPPVTTRMAQMQATGTSSQYTPP